MDDNKNNLDLVKEILTESGYENMLTAMSGQEAFFVINEKKPDLMLLDIMMPDMDGYDVCSTLKKNEETSDISIILITAKSEAEDLERGFEVGAFDYIKKPFDEVELIARVQSALKLKHSRDELNMKNAELLSLANKYKDTIDLLDQEINERKHAEEKIKQKNEELEMMNMELHAARAQLIQLNQDLEQMVKERTVEIEKLLRHKDEFINHLGHDLKTPLTPLASLLPILKKNELDPRSNEIFEICIRNISYLKNLVSNTLQLAKTNSPDFLFNIKEINLLDMVNLVSLQNQTIFKENNIIIENKIGNDIVVLADKQRLLEVFNNLSTNSINSIQGGGTLTFDVEEKPDGFVTISLRDTGIGLNEEEKTHVFEEFYKADQSRHDLSSTGLGLAICKSIVEKHGGKIWVESPGRENGTTFYFTIPMKKKIEC